MAQQSTESSVLKETTIIDADVHLSFSADDLAAQTEEPFASRIRSNYCYPAQKGSDWDPRMGGKIEHRPITTPDQVQEELVEQFHIDYPILNTIAGTGKIPSTNLAIELMKANNNVMIEKFLDPTDFYGLGVVAPQRPDQAAEEIDRIANESQIIGIFIETFAQDPPIGDVHYDPIYEAAQDNNLNIAFHGGAATGFKTDFPIQNQGVEQFLEVHTLAHLWQQSLALTSLLVQGVPVKFPDLNFIFLEAGVAWAPYLMWRLNKEYSIRRSEAPLLEKSPEQYVRERCYFASQPLGEPDNPQHMQQILDVLGENSIMFATDYPHWDFDHPSELNKHLQMAFTEEEREKILSESPAKAFGISI